MFFYQQSKVQISLSLLVFFDVGLIFAGCLIRTFIPAQLKSFQIYSLLPRMQFRERCKSFFALWRKKQREIWPQMQFISPPGGGYICNRLKIRLQLKKWNVMKISEINMYRERERKTSCRSEMRKASLTYLGIQITVWKVQNKIPLEDTDPNLDPQTSLGEKELKNTSCLANYISRRNA